MQQKRCQACTAEVKRFGVYEVDLDAGELRKRGAKAKLQGHPFQVLILLIAHPGQLLTRETLQKQLWHDDPRPVRWTKSADEIISSIGRLVHRINRTGH